MAGSQNKTTATDVPVADFLASVENDQRRSDAQTVLELMGRVTGQPAKMWGPSIIGFGSYHYKYESGREGDMCAAGFSPRKDSLVLYLEGLDTFQQPQLARLGPCKTGKVCLYIKRLADIDLAVLEQMIRDSYKQTLSQWGPG
ncbi:DUF1801 domain-containing protein [bacterium]|nr:DUF1801 domain-containing protein [bacterium]